MNDWERLHRQAEEYKESYPPGTRVMLLHMNDPYHPMAGMSLPRKTRSSSVRWQTVWVFPTRHLSSVLKHWDC